MTNDLFSVYRYMLRNDLDSEREEEIKHVQDGVSASISATAAFQQNALCNGESKPMAAKRTGTHKCKITLCPNDSMKIGDLVYVFGEHWLCMELYQDEYSVTYGELWMCNHVFNYQNHSSAVVEKHAIIDDGSYSKGTDKAIPVTDNYHVCYMSLDDESERLFVGKRLALDVIYDSKGNKVLDTCRISWLDTKGKNYGEGSHLLSFGIVDDVYNKETDNMEAMICDYIPGTVEVALVSDIDRQENIIFIEGRNSIKIGTGRTYTAKVIDEQGSSMGIAGNLEWKIENCPNGITISNNKDGDGCLVKVKMDDNLIGQTFTLTCADKDGDYIAGNKEVVVIAIG